MDNHCRMCASIFIILVSIVSCSWAESQQIAQQFTLIEVHVGEDVDLHCESDLSVKSVKTVKTVNREWKRGEEILTKANTVRTSSSRIESLNSSTILRIKNVSVDDQGEYTCVVNTKPIKRIAFNLQVQAATCDPPEKLMNGDFKADRSSTDADLYKVNDKVRYFCNRGFELVGEATRTCAGPPQGWTPDEPSCELAEIESKCSTLENKMTAMESKITSLETKITTIQNITSSIDVCASCKACKCPDGFTKLGEQCYFFGTGEKTRPEALLACQSMGSTLAYPRNSEENSLLKDHVRKNYKKLDWWIGGTDAAKEGTWVWGHNQSPFTFTDWFGSEPNNGYRPGDPTEECLFLGGQWNQYFQWHDAPCSWKEAFICQIMA